MTSSNILFCSQPKHIQFTVKEDKKKPENILVSLAFNSASVLSPRLSTGGAGQPDAGGRQHRVCSSQSHHAPRLLGRPHHLPHPQTPEDEQVGV